MEPAKIVGRYINGTVIKGFTQNFSPDKDWFHLNLFDKPSGVTIEGFLKRLKAVFVVRDFYGNPLYHERKKYIKGENPSGLKLEVTFPDGEVMVGSTALSYEPKRPGNFIIPTNPHSNNINVFVVSLAVRSVRQLFDNPEEDRLLMEA